MAAPVCNTLRTSSSPRNRVTRGRQVSFIKVASKPSTRRRFNEHCARAQQYGSRSFVSSSHSEGRFARHSRSARRRICKSPSLKAATLQREVFSKFDRAWTSSISCREARAGTPDRHLSLLDSVANRRPTTASTLSEEAIWTSLPRSARHTLTEN